MEFIKGKKTCWRSEVMQQFYRDVDGRTMEVIESTLKTTGFVKVIEIDSESLDVRYEWKG